MNLVEITAAFTTQEERSVQFYWAYSHSLHILSMCLKPGPIAHSIARMIGDPAVVSSIPALSHTFVEIYHEIFSMVNLLPQIPEGLVSVTSKSKRLTA